MNRPPTHTQPIFGLNFSLLTAAGVAEFVLANRRAAADGPGLVVTPNIDHISRLQTDAGFRHAYSGAEIITCDGFPVYYFARLRRYPLRSGRVTGCDIVMETLRSPELTHPQRLFFVVDNDATVAAVRAFAQRRGLAEAVETFVPPFGFEHDPAQCARLAEAIRNHATTLLFMGVGAPRSEIFIDRYRSLLPPCWALCVGQAVKMELGIVPTPPHFVKAANLEWMWRVFLEPRRLLKRYLFASLGFARAIVDDLRGRIPRLKVSD
jgi:N-acetylglucosaminyldiphosphoundecaprenol N-acetyl-beta-D-mannosaminyltransferase